MQFLTDIELQNHIGSIIHQDTQQQETHYDLTVEKIYQFVEGGSLDFGGSEFQPADKKPIEPQKNQGDEYGWWHLPKGTYQATMNEQLVDPDGCIVLLDPHSHAKQAGLLVNTSILSGSEANETLTMNFQVPKAGCNIKENARFAAARLMKI